MRRKKSFVPGLKIAGSRNTEGGSLRIAVHNTKTTLFGIVDKALNSLTHDELSALRDKWLAPRQADPEAVLLTSEESLWLKDHPVIDIAMMDAWPPISYVDELEHPKGVSPALLEALNKKLGGVLRLKPGPWKDNLAAVRSGELPALFDITPLPRREKDFKFTSPYLSIPHVYVARDDAPYVGREKDLAGRTLALEQGFGNVEWFRKNHPSIAVREYLNTSEALGAVSRGEADAYAGNRAVALHIMERELIGNLKVHGRVSKQPVVLAIGVRKDWPILRDILQKALRALTEAEKTAVLRSVTSARREVPEGTVEFSERERAWIVDHPRLRVAATPDWPPFEFRDEKGDYKGVTADIIRLAARRAGFDLDIVYDKWDRHLSNLAAGAIDVAPGLYDTEDRRKFLGFTRPFVELNNAIYAAVGTDDIHGIDDLDGRRVAVERGYAMNELLAKKYPGIELVIVNNTLSALQSVVVGEADAYVGNQPVANYLIRHNLLEGIRPVGFFTEHQQSLHIGVRKDWPILREILEKSLASITEEEQRVIWERWVSLGSAENGNATEPTDARALIFTIGGVAIGFILLLALVREVMRRLVARDASRLYESKEVKGTGLLLVGVALAVVILAAWITTTNTEKEMRAGVGQNLRTVLNTTHEAIRAWAANETRIIEDVARDARLVRLVEALLNVPRTPAVLRPSGELAAMRHWFTERFGKDGIKGFFIIAPDMVSVGSLRDDNVGTVNVIADNRRALLRQVFRGQTKFIPPLEADPTLQGDDPHVGATMFFAAPVRNRDGEVIAVITLRHDPRDDFSRITQLGRIGRTGETYGVDGRGRLVTASRFDAELRHMGLIGKNTEGLLNLVIRDPGGDLSDGYPLAADLTSLAPTEMASNVMRQKSGLNVDGYRDYRGVRVVGAWLWDTKLGVGLATEIDEAEAMASFWTIRLTMLVILGLTVVIALGLTGLSVWVGQNANKALRLARDNLEVQVEERTADLAEAEERNRLLLYSAGEGVFGTDREGRVMFINPKAQELLGYGAEELMGEKVHAIIHHTRADGSHYPVEQCPMYKSYTTGESHHISDEVLWRKDGSSFEVEYHSTPVFKDDEISGSVITFMDISERKEAERKLQDAYNIISESINYAGNIQQAVLTGEDMIAATMSDHFVLWEPRDVVGGDIYWCHLWGDGILVILADCTGHGVPGAFMTLISTGALDRAMAEVPPGKVGDLIQRMHQIIQITLNQHGGQGESNDGLELGVCYLEPDLGHLKFAGARFSLFLVNGGDVEEVKGTRQGLGYRGIAPNQIYAETAFDLSSGMSFYMSSDGLIEQVGGDNRRMFGKKRFKTLIAQTQSLSMAEQKAKIIEALAGYQGDEVRRDDISVIGFRI